MLQLRWLHIIIRLPTSEVYVFTSVLTICPHMSLFLITAITFCFLLSYSNVRQCSFFVNIEIVHPTSVSVDLVVYVDICLRPLAVVTVITLDLVTLCSIQTILPAFVVILYYRLLDLQDMSGYLQTFVLSQNAHHIHATSTPSKVFYDDY